MRSDHLNGPLELWQQARATNAAKLNRFQTMSHLVFLAFTAISIHKNITMRYSHSAAPLLPNNAKNAETRQVERLRHRSSLDTFVIPGRTRLPSSRVSQPQPMDLHVARGLLNTDSLQVPKKYTHRVERPDWLTPKRKKSPKPKVKACPDEESSKNHTDRPEKEPTTVSSREIVEVPQANQYSHPPKHQLRISDDYTRMSFDGRQSEGSRATSTTWSTVSHRIISNSSSGSQNRGSSRSVEEYNILAVMHGLPQFAVAAEVSQEGISPLNSLAVLKLRHSLENKSQTEVTAKTHHNWIMRKLLRRSPPSTYNLKIRTKQKPVKRMSSLSSISSMREKEHKDILKNKSLEEMGRLGGLSILLLPRGFAVDKLTLPTCISTTATYLARHGRCFTRKQLDEMPAN